MGRPAFLIGMMASGKSTVGRWLADAYGVPLIDLDRRIERMFGRSIASMFAESEAEFRRCEREALHSLTEEPAFAQRRVVVATGGGVVLDPHNLATMTAVGRTVYLDVPVGLLSTRLDDAERQARPLLAEAADPQQVLAQVWTSRRAAYEACELHIDGRGTAEVVGARVAEALGWTPKDEGDVRAS